MPLSFPPLFVSLASKPCVVMCRFLTSRRAAAESVPTAEATTGPRKVWWVASSTAVMVWPAPLSVALFGRVMVV